MRRERKRDARKQDVKVYKGKLEKGKGGTGVSCAERAGIDETKWIEKKKKK